MTFCEVTVNVLKLVVNPAQTYKTRWKFPKGPCCSFPLKSCGSHCLQKFPQVKYFISLSEGIAVLQIRTQGSSSQFPQESVESHEDSALL